MSGAAWMGLGAALFLLGLAHRLPAVAQGDARFFLALHRPLTRGPWPRFFRLIWLWGTSPPTLALLIVLALRLRPWWAAPLAYALAAGGERAVKLTLRRPRPFRALAQATLHQPRTPHDPSFPSGDALRVWFLALTLGAAFPGVAWLPPVAVTLAALVSLGRIALGAHYPLDVLAGSGLGLLAGGGVLYLLGM